MEYWEKQDKTDSVIYCLALLAQYKTPHRLSMGITLATIVLMLYLATMNALSAFWVVVLIITIVLGLVEHMYAARIRFDILLFKKMSRRSEDIETELAKLDRSLLSLRILPANKSGRSLVERLQGCIRLLKIQVAISLLQIITLLCAVVLDVTFS